MDPDVSLALARFYQSLEFTLRSPRGVLAHQCHRMQQRYAP
jgi:hypothetical protein